jgi:hypothetical protein
MHRDSKVQDRKKPLSISVVLAAAIVLATTIVASPSEASIGDKNNDFNGDTISDVVAISDDGCLWRWNGNGFGGLGAGVNLGCDWYSFWGSLLTPGDLNGDRHADLLAVDTSGGLWRAYGNGNGGFGARARLGGGWNDYKDTLTAGDFNNDGAGDLLAVSADGHLVRWLGDGRGSVGVAHTMGPGWGVYYPLLAAGDLNGDGNGDLVAVHLLDDGLYRWYGDGRGNFGVGQRLGGGWTDYFSLSGMGDLNGDGVGDLVGRSFFDDEDCLYRWLGNGSGSYGRVQAMGCGWSYYLAR